MGARSRSGARSWGGAAGAWRRQARLVALAGALCSCSLDFSIAGRQFECPPEVTGCLACNPDGTCRELDVGVEPVLPGGPPVGPVESEPDAGVSGDAGAPPPVEASPDAGPSGPTDPDPGPPDPPVVVDPPGPAECAQFASRESDELCLEGASRCFSLGSVLSPSLTAWLDPTTLPEEGSRYWCDRSGKGHHALLELDDGGALVQGDGRTAGTALSRSLALDGGWLALDEGGEPVLRPGNFAVLVAAATPLESSDGDAFGVFESGADSKISLAIAPEDGLARGSISSTETALVPDPVVTRSSVYDGGFHLYSLYRRSEVRVLDDVLQLRLNGVLEFRGSSIAIPRALDLSRSPRIGRSSTATGSGRVAAIVILRGSVPEDELARLETFLCQELGVCSPPSSPLGEDPAGEPPEQPPADDGEKPPADGEGPPPDAGSPCGVCSRGRER